MAYVIGKVRWKNRTKGIFKTLQGNEINFLNDRTGLGTKQLVTGLYFIADVIVQTNENQQEVVNFRHLEEEKREEILLPGFSNGDSWLVDEALKHVTSEEIIQKIRSRLPQYKQVATSLNRDRSRIVTLTSDQQRFFSLASQSVNSLQQQVNWSPETVAGYITPEDRELAEMWIPETTVHHDPILAQMLSARMAELVAQKFYKGLGHYVYDEAIKQLTDDGEWRLYDIKLDNRVCVDVKNARSPVNNKKRYSNFCIPRFKHDRSGSDVIIASVFSPYLNLEQIEGRAAIHKEKSDLIFLGETNQTTIQALERGQLNSKLHVQINSVQNDEGGKVTVLPPWAFDYPQRFYIKQVEARKELKKIVPLKYPSEDLWQPGENPIPALVACHLPIPENWVTVNDNQRDFIELLWKWNASRITLPILYLTLLSDFLDKVACSQSELTYNPKDYYPILYERKGHFITPLGIRDPLNIIQDLLGTLETLWDKRDNVPWQQIATFHLKGTGYLTGTTVDGKQITIIAYCGGIIDQKGKCGAGPLIAGINNPCPHGKLICHEEDCHYCCKECQSEKKGTQNH